MTMTEERKQEIEAATPKNPVYLTNEEVEELRAEKPHRLQQDVGAGRYIIPVSPDSPGAKALEMRKEGRSVSDIARELDIKESTLHRLFSRFP